MRNDFDAMWNLFIRVAGDIGKVICVLDALDKCKSTERESLVKCLKAFYTSKRASRRQESSLKFFMTSRPLTENEPSLFSLVQSVPAIRLTGEDESEVFSNEIDIVMELELQTITEDLGLEEYAHSLLRDRLQRIPNRTYLWLHLVLGELRYLLEQTGMGIEQVMDTLPETVEDAYKIALGRCNRDKTEGRILHIILAAKRPLALTEIGVALKVDIALMKSRDPAELLRFLDNLDVEMDKTKCAVQAACGIFINIVGSRVVLSHLAKEFLSREIKEFSEQTGWTKSIDIRSAHRTLSRICVTYLLLPEIQNYSLPRYEYPRETHTFLEYSASSWVYHVQQACDDEAYWIRQTLKLCDIGDGIACYWYRFYSKASERHTYRPLAPQSKQIWAVVFGLINVLQSLRRSKVDHSSLVSSTVNIFEGAAEGSGRGENYPNRGKHKSTTPDLRAAVERPLDWHALDIPIDFEALEILSKQPTAQEVMQVIFDSRRPELWINSMKDAASLGRCGIATMQLILQQQGANTLITEEIMEAAAEGNSVDMMQLLLQQQGVNALITEEVLKAATRNLDNPDRLEVILLLLDQPGSTTLITQEVWEAVSGFHRYARVTILKSLLGKITITEEVIATIVRVFDRISVELLLNQRGADVSITAEVVKAALENTYWSKGVSTLLFKRYKHEVHEALTLLGEEGKIAFERKEDLVCVKSSAGWLYFSLKGTVSDRLEESSVEDEVEDADEAEEIDEVDGTDKVDEVHNKINQVHDEINEVHEAYRMEEVHEGHEREGATSTHLLPHSWVEGSMTPDSSQDLRASSPDRTGGTSRFPSMVSLQSLQRVYCSIRWGLSILPWIETSIFPGHQRIYWRNVSTFPVLSFMLFWIHHDN